MDVAEELLDIDQTVDRTYVERRLNEWRTRVDRLYGDIAAWLPATWSMADGGRVPILEDLMLKFQVPPQTLPVKGLLRDGKMAGRIEPRSLWIIGANGRVDIILPEAHYLVVDRTESFEAPDWKIAPLTARRDEVRLTRDVVAQILA